MKNGILIIFLLLTKLVFSNEIDKLKSESEVQEFLITKVNPEWKFHNFFKNTSEKDSTKYGKNKFFKVDIDKNGLTDLIVNAKYFFAVLDLGNGKYDCQIFDKGTFNLDKYTLLDILNLKNETLLLVKPYNKYKIKTNEESQIIDTLVYKFGGFCEYNKKPNIKKIVEIKFTTTSCYGNCPVFGIIISSNRKANYFELEKDIVKNNENCLIDNKSFQNIINTINYLKIDSLKNTYSEKTDAQTVVLEIKFSDGQTKKIIDHDASGTFGLTNLYGKFFDLRTNQKWNK